MHPLPHEDRASAVDHARLLAQLVFAILTVLCVVAVVVDLGRPAGGRLIETGVGLICFAAVVAGVATLAVRIATVRRDRLAWSLVALGAIAWGASSIAFSFWGRPASATGATLIDVGFIGFYPAVSLALWLLLRARVVHFFSAAWLDVLIGLTGAIAACVAVAVIWLLPAAEPGSYLAGNTQYPFLDAALLAQLAAGFVLTGGRLGRTWVLLASGITCFAVADTSYVLLLVDGSEHPFVMSPFWIAALGLVATASVQPTGVREARMSTPGVATFALPLGFALLMTGLLVAGSFTALPPATAILSGVGLVLVFLRTALTFRENLQLAETREQAVTDELTGLANRRALGAALERLSRLGDDAGTAGLVICDLDGFKFINDTLGHGAGDEILAELGRRLRRTPGFALIARLGGDEFAAILPAPAGPAALADGAARLRAAFAEPVMVDGIALQVSGSMGGALTAPGMPAGELMRHADVAMYRAKADDRPFEAYRPERDDHSPAQLRLAAELRAGLRTGQLRIHYQPKVRLRDGVLTGVEALVRWQHPRHGLIPPDQMLAIAQRAGLMRQVTSAVLDGALGQLAAWDAEGGRRLSMAVNLSISDLHDSELPIEVGRLLARHGIEGERLVLEVTEDLVMARPERVIDVVEGLRGLGIGIVLDDFGAGRSSLAYVRRLQVAELKIDKQFMMRVDRDVDARAIVRGAVELAHELGLRVVAEGVETPAGWQLLRETGCEEAQGFLISRPVPPDAIDLTLSVGEDGPSGLAVA